MKYLLLIIMLVMQGGPKNIADYFRAFPYKGDLTLEESDNNDVTIDLPNAYVKVVNHGTEDYQFDSEMEFVYFVTAAKSKVFGMAHVDKGPESDKYGYGFYRFEQNKWIDVTDEILPELSLELFIGDVPEVAAIGSQYQLEINLPQQGTNVTVTPRPVGETDHPFYQEQDGYTKYLNVFNKMLREEIILKWNREKGVFEMVK